MFARNFCNHGLRQRVVLLKHARLGLDQCYPKCPNTTAATINNEGSNNAGNERFGEEYVNRNPMDLERNFLAHKPSGRVLDDPRLQDYWNKVVLEKTGKYVTAKVVHCTGRVVITASTREWAIRKQLLSATDVNAVRNIARVLARRCLETGILFVSCDVLPREMETNERQKIFAQTLRENGLCLEEPEQIEPPDTRQIG